MLPCTRFWPSPYLTFGNQQKLLIALVLHYFSGNTLARRHTTAGSSPFDLSLDYLEATAVFTLL